MPQDQVLLLSDDHELCQVLRRNLEPRHKVVPAKTPRQIPRSRNGYTLVIIPSRSAGMAEMRALDKGHAIRRCAVLIAPPAVLKKTAERIAALSDALLGDGVSKTALRDFVEHNLREFVQRIKTGRGKNLYSILLQEFEKPLITLILRETKGNQVQAAELLGVNRNTLRKKIRELKIVVK